MANLAEATVRVILDVSRFDNELQAAVQKAADKAGRSFDRQMTKNLRQAGANAAKEFENAASASMTRAGQRTAAKFEAGFTQGTATMGSRVGQKIGSGLQANVTRAGIRAGRGFADNLSKSFQGQGLRVGRDFANALNTGMMGRLRSIAASVGGSLLRGGRAAVGQAGRNLGNEFSLSIGVGTLRGSRPLAAAIAVLASEIISQVGPALGILAGTAPLLTGAALSAGVAAAAFTGMGDAFKGAADADFEKLTESMERLSPAARSVVREFIAMRPALASLQQAIQEAFFRQLSGQITNLTRAFTGPLRTGILDTANAMGALGRGFLDMIASAQGVGNINRTFRGTADFFDRLRPGIQELTKGFLDFSGAAAPGLVSISEGLANMLAALGRWMTASAKSGRALEWIESGITGIEKFVETLQDLGQIFGTIAAAARPLTFVFAGLFDLVADLARLFSQLPGPIQTAVLAAILFTRTGLPDFLQRTTAQGGPLRNMLTSLSGAYRSGADATRAFVQQQTQLAAVSQAITGSTNRVVTAIQGVGSAFGAVAAPIGGAANALRRGFGAALSGLMGVLGGPWGLALAAAGVALAVFADNQAKAARAAAAYNSQVREIQSTLNRTTGAVTLATTEMAASDERVSAAGRAWREFGVATSDVVQGAVRAGDAHNKVEAALRRQVGTILDNNRANKDLDAVMAATGLSAEELTTALLGGSREMERLNQIEQSLLASQDPMSAGIAGVIGRLKEQSSSIRDTRSGWLEYYNQTQKATEAQRLVAASMPPATREAQKLADAMSILADNTADADSKAQAFQQIMTVLAGGTVGVQAAMAGFNETILRIKETTTGAQDATKGWGAALIAANGQINTTSANGQTLFNTYQSLTSGLSTSSAALIDNALKTGDVSGALKQVAANVQTARDAFVAQAQAMGIPEAKAQELANAYGLIPKDVVTNVAVPAYENVRAQLQDVANKVKDIPPDKFVNVGALTTEAQQRLKDIGFTVNNLPDGTVEVRANTQPAKDSLSSLLANWGNRVINWVVNAVGGNAMGGIMPNAAGRIVAYREGGTHMRKMPANRAEVVPPRTYRLIGDRARHDEAYIPINNSARSRAILAATARRMEFDLVPRGARTVASAQPSVSVAAGAIVVQAPFSDPELVARAVVNELAREVVR